MHSMSMIGNHAKVGQGINTNDADLTVAQQSPKGRDRDASEEEAYEEKGEVEAYHLCHLSDQTAKIMSAVGQLVRAGGEARGATRDLQLQHSSRRGLKVANKMRSVEIGLQN
jgi:hypothetical protein